MSLHEMEHAVSHGKLRLLPNEQLRFQFLGVPTEQRQPASVSMRCCTHTIILDTDPFKLTAHEQHAGPNSSSRPLLTRWSIKMPFPVAKQNISQASQTTIFLFVDL